MKIFNKLRKIKKKLSSHQPLIDVFISKENIIHNFNQFKERYPNLDFSPVLKSNAYGHGLEEIAKILEDQEKSFLIVDSIFEARKLRSLGIDENILIIGYTPPEEIKKQKFKNLSFLVVSFPQLKKIDEKINKKINIHLKFDTGMSRQGLTDYDLDKSIKIVKSNKNLNLEGVCSHLADADNENDSFTLKQINRWNKLVKRFKKEFNSTEYFHLSATSGTRFSDKISANMVRLGLGLYGFNTYSKSKLNLKPALSVKTIITSIRELKPGDCVGYNTTFETDKKMKVATIPFGYFEGMDRRLSNKGFVKINNKFCPIVGRVSMNLTSIDVSSISNLNVGDKVTVISKNIEDKNLVSNMAKMCETIPYVILIHIPEHLKRTIIK